MAHQWTDIQRKWVEALRSGRERMNTHTDNWPRIVAARREYESRIIHDGDERWRDWPTDDFADMTREESTEDVVRMLRAFTASIAAGLCIFGALVWWQADAIASVIAAAVLWATGG